MKESVEQLQTIPLFLIAKSCPGSSLAKLEWRISFSLVELEILINLPYQRKAFLHLKHHLEKVEEIPSYFLKTTLLTISAYFQQEYPQEEWNTEMFYKELTDNLERAILKKNIPNFFLPEQNLFLLEEEDLSYGTKTKSWDDIYAQIINSKSIDFRFPVAGNNIDLNDND
eukprot:TCONS_00015081-protein